MSSSSQNPEPDSARRELREYADRYGYTEHVNKLLDAFAAEMTRANADWLEGIGQDHAASMLRYSLDLDAEMAAAAPVPDETAGDETGEAPARCTCARSCGLHSKECALYTPGHELASPAAELERLRIFALATNRRHQEVRDRLAQVDIREGAEAWDLGMAVLALLEGPLPRSTEAGDQR